MGSTVYPAFFVLMYEGKFVKIIFPSSVAPSFTLVLNTWSDLSTLANCPW